MNPIVKIKAQSKYVIYKLTPKDKKKLEKVRIVRGGKWGRKEDYDIHHTMCIMQAISLVTVQAGTERLVKGYTDHPICVSPEITSALISINDSLSTLPQERELLKKLIPDVLNTSPVRTTVERRRGKEYTRQRRVSTKEFRKIEQKRAELLNLVDCQGLSFSEIVKRIKEAADLYRVEDTGDDLSVVEI